MSNVFLQTLCFAMINHAQAIQGSADTFKCLCRMYEDAFFLCLLDLLIVGSHHFSCFKTCKMNFFGTETFCSSRTVKGNIAAAKDDDFFAHACFFAHAGIS